VRPVSKPPAFGRALLKELPQSSPPALGPFLLIGPVRLLGGNSPNVRDSQDPPLRRIEEISRLRFGGRSIRCLKRRVEFS